MGLEVTVRDLVRSYVVLRDGSVTQTSSAARLLQFYSVECGLKAAILGKNGINARSTSDMAPELRTHDLRALAKELRLAAPLVQQLASCRRRYEATEKVEVRQLHEAWRYGAALNEDDEKHVDAALSGLSNWCREEHRH